MTFPLIVGPHEVADPQALAALVRRDAAADGGSLVVPGMRPAAWLADLVAREVLPRRLALGLAAALLQHADPGTVTEGARLAVALGDPRLARLVTDALSRHDTALLLQPDPGDPRQSVEDALLRAAVEVAELSDEALRTALLERLRHAGLRDVELRLLCAHGSTEELVRWLPAVLEEEPEPDDLAVLAARVGRRDPGAERLLSLLREHDPDLHTQVLTLAAS